MATTLITLMMTRERGENMMRSSRDRKNEANSMRRILVMVRINKCQQKYSGVSSEAEKCVMGERKRKYREKNAPPRTNEKLTRKKNRKLRINRVTKT